MLEFLLCAFMFSGGLVSIGSVIALIGTETKRKEITAKVVSVVGIVVAYICAFALIAVCKGE